MPPRAGREDARGVDAQRCFELGHQRVEERDVLVLRRWRVELPALVLAARIDEHGLVAREGLEAEVVARTGTVASAPVERELALVR